EFFIEGANPTREVIHNLYEVLRRLCKRGPIEMPMSEIAEHVVAAENDMAVGTALYLLERAKFIERDYRQGSRTYTTRLVEPVKALDDLEIDYDRLDAKRARDTAKLRRMIDYADHHGCRHAFILQYFGDTETREHCGACDCCLRTVRPKRRARKAQTEAPPLETSAEEKTVLLQKALSCVARMEGRFGLGRITLVLVGSRSKDVFDWNLDKLSTYGLLKEFGYDFTIELLRRLAAAKCIHVTADQYPKASLTPLGREVMAARKPLDIELPPFEKLKPAAKQPAAVAAVMGEEPYDEKLFAALRRWRLQLAGKMQVPPYLIYPDKTLKELSRVKPQTEAELLEVRGIGPAKARQFGEETLALIRQHTGE
ncbi:MAG: hypothetical protein FJ388_07045, partial [Verrucomicrobia bacterium]|nr:hypothetical protein [Verrucomicrobiota bacterium]